MTVAAPPGAPAAPHWSTRERLALASLLGLAAAALAYHAGSIGWGNAYYAAVAQSGATGWKAFFFATPDISAVTATDKPPLAFWPMALSVRLFGLHGWAIALPQMLEYLACVAVLHATVRRVAGAAGGLVAATALAVTPVAFALARFNDPDTLLTLAVTVGAYAAVRAAEANRPRWLVLLGAALGTAFLTKWLAGAVPAPALVLAALVGRRPPDVAWRRGWTSRAVVRGLALVTGVAAVTGLWWLAVAVAVRSRPFPDSSTGGFVDVILNQNGVDRFSYTTATAASATVKGRPGPLRLLADPFAGQVGWLVPMAALVLLVLLVSPTVRRRTPPAATIAFGGWFALTGLVFSLMGGAMHPYYTVLMAPATAALVGLGVPLGCRQARRAVRWLPTAAVVASGGYASAVLSTQPTLTTWRVPVLTTTIAAGLLLLTRERRRRVAGVTLAVAALVLGPAAFALATSSHPLTGANPMAGPSSGTGARPAYAASFVAYLENGSGSRPWVAAVITSTPASVLQLQSRRSVLPLGGFTGHSGFPDVAAVRTWVERDELRYLVLSGPYAHLSAPPSLRHTATQAVVDWARAHSCAVRAPGTGYTVLDLSMAPPCPVTR